MLKLAALLWNIRYYSSVFIAKIQLEPEKIKPVFVEGGKIAIKPKSKAALSKEFDLHPQTIASMCTRIGIETEGRRLSIKQVVAFYKHYGTPTLYDLDEL